MGDLDGDLDQTRIVRILPGVPAPRLSVGKFRNLHSITKREVHMLDSTELAVPITFYL